MQRPRSHVPALRQPRSQASARRPWKGQPHNRQPAHSGSHDCPPALAPRSTASYAVATHSDGVGHGMQQPLRPLAAWPPSIATERRLTTCSHLAYPAEFDASSQQQNGIAVAAR